MNRRSGLGRGLAALIPQAPAPDNDSRAARETPSPGADDRDDARDGDGSSSPTDQDARTGVGDDERASAPRPVTADRDPQQTSSDGVPSPTRDAAVGDLSTHAEDAPVGGSGSVGAPGTDVATQTETPGNLISASAATLTELKPHQIVPNPRQPREVFEPEELEGLATSLADLGMLQPVVVRPLDDGRYELIAGERRLRASKLAGLVRIPAVVRHTEDADLLKEALVENIHRVQLNPLEEAAAYEQLLEDFGVTQEELARSLGRSRPAISNAIRLLQLPTAVQRRVAAGVLSAGHAKALLAVGDQAAQVRLAERIVAEGLSVRATEELVRLRAVDDAPPTSSKRRRAVTAPGLLDLQEDLSDALMARVQIAMGARRGKLTIEFTSVDDLERIVTVIADGLDEGARPTGNLGALAAGRSDQVGTEGHGAPADRSTPGTVEGGGRDPGRAATAKDPFGP